MLGHQYGRYEVTVAGVRGALAKQGIREGVQVRLARDRVYEFLYLNLTERIKGATGSPVRPIAIR